LGLRWVDQGYKVMFGSAFEHELNLVKGLRPTALTGDLTDAAAFGDILLYSVRGVAPSAVLDPQHLAGKVVIDINNFGIPADFAYPAVTESLAEQTQRDVPQARVVKAFNNLAMEVYELPAHTLQFQKVATYLAGNDAQAKQQVAVLARTLGLNPVDVGPLRQARLLESMGDFVRLLMGGQARLGGMAHLSVQVLPTPEETRLGGRQASLLNS
jgi:8-hydroxy-5-deazaflavin:NADPH oxidoreductase